MGIRERNRRRAWEVLPCRKRYWWEGVRQTLTFTCLPFLPAANWDKFVWRAGLYLSRARYKERGVNYHPSPTLSCSFFLPPPGPLPCLPATSHHAISSTTVSSCYHPVSWSSHLLALILALLWEMSPSFPEAHLFLSSPRRSLGKGVTLAELKVSVPRSPLRVFFGISTHILKKNPKGSPLEKFPYV